MSTLHNSDSASTSVHHPDSTTETTNRPPLLLRGPELAGLPPAVWLVGAAVLLAAALTDHLPTSLLSGFAITMVTGGLLMWIGKQVPVLRDCGLPTILCTFVPAVLLFAGAFPQTAEGVVSGFVEDGGFLDFLVITIIAGSILGMPRTLLLRAGPRFAVPLLGCLTLTFLIAGAVGSLLGFGFVQAILLVAAPIMAGGLGIGAVPMSEMYAGATGGNPDAFMGQLMSAVVVANILCIVIAGVYNGLGRREKQLFVGFDGHGQLMRAQRRDIGHDTAPGRNKATYTALGQGLLIAGLLFVLGELLGGLLPVLHPYAWTIIAAAIVKIAGLLPRHLEEASTSWGAMVTQLFVPALLVAVSLTYIDIADVLTSLSSPLFLVLTAVTVLSATLTSGLLGWLVKFHFVEAAITPGLVMADTGGSGDVAVLSAANRMHLMPFAALTNRLGGAVVLFVTSMIAPLLATPL
ncbi:2-hydroxycarboxylate transporter family protein [Saccharopolyspora mangrovi]|uniref:2-hydroxycarboxylate transporter family protein n=1 Tax=Saccharopolyspora mangrovi TaxID=3082379 RepID=A0ABU6AG73_9PSEU|nr:2-hydroxycarboxylate transporter family protein [Saccharopolyspora sp. S2-29]MEB3370468.1 2-hydroxycarboxylate transporter family protein [Saccharopolyspora sp. S2-29]